MRSPRLAIPLLVALLLALPSAHAALGPTPQKKKKSDPAQANPGKKGAARLPLCGLPPAKIIPNLCVVKYRISTTSPECQAFFDQGLGYFYSYVWHEASRSFETAAKFDPDCAMAWWALSRALERYGKGNQKEALKKAQALLDRCSHREKLLITARLQEKGMVAGAGGDTEARRTAAIQSIDTLLALYDDDEEGWYARAQLAGGAGLFGGRVSAVPYYKALLKLNPLHPGANHELVHFYENFKRPALGMPYADKYIESSPGIPHAWHMQAHLATRLGRWDKTTDRSTRAVELHRAYQKDMKVTPFQDSQFNHHLETLLLGLIHDGRFDEGRKLKAECEGYKIYHKQQWFRLFLAERAWDDALKMAEQFRKDKLNYSYMKALVYLRKGDTARAAPEVAVLQQAYAADKRHDKTLEMRLWETQGMLMCQQGQADGGLKLLAKLVERTKDDYRHHSWGNGAVYMEWWGAAALRGQVERGGGGVPGGAGARPGQRPRGAGHAGIVRAPGPHRGGGALRRTGGALLAAGEAGEPGRGTGGAARRRCRHLGDAGHTSATENGETAMMCTRTLLVVGVLALTAVAAAQPPLRSGLDPGQRPGPYASVVVSGPQRGQSHCFICETADRPAVIIFARTASEPLGKLAKQIDRAVTAHKTADLRAWLTILAADQASEDGKLVKWAQRHALGTMSISVFEDVVGPPTYRIGRDADVVVLLSVKQKVVANFAFRPGELTDARAAEVLRALPQILGEKK